jgi:hypothetical protein
MSAIAKKSTLFEVKCKLVIVIWTVVGIAGTPESAKKRVGRFGGKKLLNG